jgi:hypothetical protein
MEAFVGDHHEEVALLRRARAELDPGRAPREPMAGAGRLRWEDLTPEERRGCPTLVAVGNEEDWVGKGLDWLLALGLPVKALVLADPAGPLAGTTAGDTALQAILGRVTFVLQSSIGATDHFMNGARRAFGHEGPALLRIHAPSPGRDGFPAASLIEMARLATETAIHPLYIFDPRRDGVFGSRFELAGFPAKADPAGIEKWLACQVRFASLDEVQRKRWCDDRLGDFRMLREIAGVESPFVDTVRKTITFEVEEDRRREEAGQRLQIEAEMAARVKHKLMALAGCNGRPEEVP